MSLTLEEVNMIINQNIKDPAVKAAMISDAKEIEADKKSEKDPAAKKSKYNYTIIVRSDNPAIKDALENTEAFISKSDESIDQSTILERMKVAAIEQNRNCKKRGKIFTISDYFAAVKSKFHKNPNAGIKNVSKEPVRIVVCEKAEFDFG